MEAVSLQHWRLTNEHMTLEVQSLGGMIGPCLARLGERTVSPLAVAPWADEPEAAGLPPILRRLRGEWPCVPFGITQPVELFPPRHRTQDTRLDGVIDNSEAHGYGSNNHWACLDKGDDWIELAIDYPETSSVRRLRRRIALAADVARIDLELGVEVRDSCRLPLGLHPVLALADEAGQCVLRPGRFVSGRTYPIRFEPSSRLAVDAAFDDLSRVPQNDGSTIDLTRLPLTEKREELVQLHGVDGCFTLLNRSKGYRAVLQWNPDHFPSCILWISNRGRDAYPWLSRHLAIGIEPTCSFFDLNPSMAPDALHAFASGENWRTAYSLTIGELENRP